MAQAKGQVARIGSGLEYERVWVICDRLNHRSMAQPCLSPPVHFFRQFIFIDSTAAKDREFNKNQTLILESTTLPHFQNQKFGFSLFLILRT
jgi:hypothetical protein